MSTTSSSILGGRFGAVAVTAILLGGFVSASGVLLISTSLLGGLWVVAIGLSLALAGVFATTWAAARLDLSPARQRTLALSFAGLSLVLLASFVVVNTASFEGPSVATGN